jgi:hypothetical protein
MDAVQRAFESQIRREDYKRVQLHNAVRVCVHDALLNR